MDLHAATKLAEQVRIFEERLEVLRELVNKLRDYNPPTAEQKIVAYEVLVSYHQLLEDFAHGLLVHGLTDMAEKLLGFASTLKTLGAEIERA